MADKINSLNDLVQKLSKVQFQLEENLVKAVAVSAEKVKHSAEAKFGHYQPGIGGFPAWANLADSTLEEKFRNGATQDDPLIGYYPNGRTTKRKKVKGTTKSKSYNGKLMNSFKMKHVGLVAIVGTNDPVAKYHEFGTKHILPRPFLRPALYQEQEFIQTEFRKAVVKTIKNM
jgi:HK97 gp10 family phage protein